MNDAVRPGVAASNELTRRWVDAIGTSPGNFVLSGAATWPLLSVLAFGSEGATRNELEGALGMPADAALEEGLALLHDLERNPDTASALGIWIRDDVELKDDWVEALPQNVIGRLSGVPGRDRATLDSWVEDTTSGILKQLPTSIDEETLMLLAQALVLRTQWVSTFEDYPWHPRSGSWTGRELRGLFGRFHDLDRVVVFDSDRGPLTTFRSIGREGVDVYLTLGAEELSTTTVLAEAITALTGGSNGRSGTELAIGYTAPGIAVREERTFDPDHPSILVQTVRFDIEVHHQLLEHADVFGLTSASQLLDFVGIGSPPLQIGSAKQAARARFTATGFEAAAVTVEGMVAGIASETSRVIEVTFDRPFAFLAIDRHTRLVLFAGCVEDPDLMRPPDEPSSPSRRPRSG